jgi:hypothetical protein
VPGPTWGSQARIVGVLAGVFIVDDAIDDLLVDIDLAVAALVALALAVLPAGRGLRAGGPVRRPSRSRGVRA